MTRIPAGRRAALAALALTGLGACTVIDEPGYYPTTATAPPGYVYGSSSYYTGAPAARYGVPDYVASAAAGDTYCQEALASVRRSQAEAAYSGSPAAVARLDRARNYASRDC